MDIEKKECHICGKRVKNIDEHIRDVHPEEVGVVKCPHCHKEISEEDILDHIKTDHGEEVLRSVIVKLSRLKIGKDSIRKTKEKLKKLEKTVKIQSDKNKSLESENETLNSKKETLERECEILNSKKELLEREYETLNGKYQTAKKEKEPLIKDIDNLKQKVNDLNRQILDLTDKKKFLSPSIPREKHLVELDSPKNQ